MENQILISAGQSVEEIYSAIQAHLKEKVVLDGQSISPGLIDKNGVLYSIQASENHYCSPQDSIGPWETVEVVIYSDEDSEGNVYSFVSVKEIAQMFYNTGGDILIFDTEDSGISSFEDEEFEDMVEVTYN
jgi:hypothetical protein